MSKPVPHYDTRGVVKAILVRRSDVPGKLLLGVHVNGGRCVCPLPEGYDGRTSLCVHKGYVLVAHPLLPALQCDPTTGGVKLIEPGHIEAKPGRMRLRTH